MATNRFQRWLTKKNESLEESQESDGQLTAQSNGVLDSTEADSNAETIIEPESELNLSTNQSTNEISFQNDQDEIQATQDLPLTTIAHVFADGFSKQEKQQQLRALFHSDEFSGIDPLDSYNMDYTKVKSLPKEVADTLRSWHKRVEEVFEEDEDLEVTNVEPEKPELAHSEKDPCETETNLNLESNNCDVNKSNEANINNEGEIAKVAMDESNKKSG